MMSVSPGMGLGHASGYFSKEEDYLKGLGAEENSRWFGQGAQALGLSGAVREEEFLALCRGEDPAGRRIVIPRLSRDRESGELVEVHRAGNDSTFSDPKSVSIAYAAGVRGIKQARDAAVLSVLEHIERPLPRPRGGLERVPGGRQVRPRRLAQRLPAAALPCLHRERGPDRAGKTYALGIGEQFNEEVLKPGGRGFVSLNLSYTAKAAREMGLATGRPAFTVDSFLNCWSASKFDLQRQNSGPAILEVADEKVLITEGAAVIIRVDEASFSGRGRRGSSWMRPMS